MEARNFFHKDSHILLLPDHDFFSLVSVYRGTLREIKIVHVLTVQLTGQFIWEENASNYNPKYFSNYKTIENCKSKNL